MRLRRFRIRAFRSVRDSGDVPVGDIAGLVGKNETGKTAILEGLTHLNSNLPIDELDICDELGDQITNETVVVEGTFELSDSDRKKFKEQAPSMPDIKEVTITRRKDNAIEYDFNPQVTSQRALAQEEWKKFSASMSEVCQGAPQEITDFWKTEVTDPDKLTEMMGKSERFLASQSSPNPKALEEFGKLKTNTQSLFGEDLRKVAKQVVTSIHPKLVYFSDYKKIMGGVQLEEYLKGPGVQLKDRLDSGEPLDKRDTIENLFFLARLDAKKLDANKAKPAVLTKLLNDGERHLTDELSLHWKGTPKHIGLRLQPNTILTVVVSDINPDGSTSNTGLLTRHSEGFKWYFSFLVNFKAETKKSELKEAILLLDEPGLHLHPAQQLDIVELVKELSMTNQIIYSTHSPFMLFDYKVGSILVVQVDPATHLSKVETRYWTADSETIRPIMMMLGGGQLLDNISKTKRPVVVLEGPTDYQYLVAMQDALTQDDYHPIGWVQLVPTNGMNFTAPLALFHKVRGYNTFILLDNHAEARKMSEEVGKSGFEQSRIMFVGIDSKKEADVEDLFTENDYLEAVNSVYVTTLREINFSPITRDMVRVKSDQIQTVRIVKVLEAIFEEHSTDNWGAYDKMKVCRKLCELVAQKQVGKESKERFRTLFEMIEKKVQEFAIPLESKASQVEMKN